MQERIPDTNYQSMHHFISESKWDALAVMDEVAQQYDSSFRSLPTNLPQGLILDECGWEKSGKKSVGVARQYIGNVGKVSNGVVGVFAALVKGEHVGIVGGRLYLPKEWTGDSARCNVAKIPVESQVYKTKPELAGDIVINLAEKAQYEWVGGDAVYGDSPHLRNLLKRKRFAFVMDCRGSHRVYLQHPELFLPEPQDGRGRHPSRFQTKQTAIAIEDIAAAINEEQWKTITYRTGTKGPKKRKALIVNVWLWDQNNGDVVESLQLIISMETDGTEVKYSFCHEPQAIMLVETALYRQMQRYWVERAFQDAKEQLGMDQYQVRSWIAWYHHIALTMMALHFITHSRIEEMDDYPLLSCPDVKIIIAKSLSNKLNTNSGVEFAINNRHRQRQTDIDRYKNYS
jgi:SRSO17 transposase